MKIRLASDITRDSIVDGHGIRAVIWTQGCPHKCKSCHNPQTHNFNEGIEAEVEDLINDLDKLKLHSGITLSGGEPLLQAEACSEIAKYAKKRNLNVWMYTGYTFETVVKAANTYRPDWALLLNHVDVLVDGPFIEEMQQEGLKFRGSSNQRIIDVKRSFATGKIVEYGEKEYVNIKSNVG